MDMNSLVNTIASLIGPVLPELVKDATQEVLAHVGKEAWEQISLVWQRLKSAFESDATLKPVGDLARNGIDADYSDLLRKSLGKYLAENPAVAMGLAASAKISMEILATHGAKLRRVRNENALGVAADMRIVGDNNSEIEDGVNYLGGADGGRLSPKK